MFIKTDKEGVDVWLVVTLDPPEMSYDDPLSSPPGLCCIVPSVESPGRFSHHSSRSAGPLLPAGLWRLGSG